MKTRTRIQACYSIAKSPNYKRFKITPTGVVEGPKAAIDGMNNAVSGLRQEVAASREETITY